MLLFVFSSHSGIIIGHSPCEKAIQTPANKGSGFHALFMRVLRIAPLLFQLSLQLGLNLQKRKTSGSYFELSMGSMIAIISLKKTICWLSITNQWNYSLLVSEDGTSLDLLNRGADAFPLQVAVSQILVDISLPVQAHSMKELE